jgi:hypothetical protein
MPKSNTELSDDAKNATIDRSEFDAVMKKLVNAKPITREQVAAKIKGEGRAASHAVKRSGQR